MNDDVLDSESPRQRFLRRFKRQKIAVWAALFLLLVTMCAIFAAPLSPFDPTAQSLGDSLQGPSGEHWLGTNRLGRDSFSRLIYGSRFSLLAGFEAVGVAVVLGVPIGLLTGLIGGWFDAIISTIADAILSVPAIVLALAIVGILGPGLTNGMVAIGIVYSPRLYRVVRGAAITVREETFIDAARLSGLSSFTIARRHVFPSVLSPLIVQISLALGFAVLAEAALSFLGLGVQPPDASWGVMLGEGTSEMEDHPELVIAPGLAIVFTVLAFNLLGDGLNASLGREERRS